MYVSCIKNYYIVKLLEDILSKWSNNENSIRNLDFRIKLSIYLSNFTLIDETQEMDIDSNVELVKADARGFCKLCRNKGKSKSSSFYFAIDAHGLCIKTVLSSRLYLHELIVSKIIRFSS